VLQTQSEVALTLHPGWGGVCSNLSRWVPLRITLANSGPAITAHVQVTYDNDSSGEVSDGADVKVPSASQKDVFLYLLPQSSVIHAVVTLRPTNQTVLNKNFTLFCNLPADNSLVGLLSDDPASLSLLKDLQVNEGFAQFIPLQLADLPDRPEGWGSLDSLIVSNIDTQALTSEQQHAMELWLVNGGRLIIAGGPNWQATNSGLQKFLPLDTTSTEPVSDLLSLQSYFQTASAPTGEALLNTGPLRSSAQAIVAQDGIPVIIQRPFGFGEVIYLAADLAAPPLRNWPDSKKMFGSLLATRPPRPPWNSSRWDIPFSNGAASTLSNLNVPPALAVIGWLGLYILVIGPVNFLILKRLKRRTLAWLSIPMIAIIFSGIAYGLRTVYLGTRPVLNRVSVVQAWDGEGSAEVKSLIGLYSPSRARYTLLAKGGFFLYPYSGSPEYSNSTAQLESGSTLQWAEGTQMADLPVEIGGLRIVAAQGDVAALPLSQNLVLEIQSGIPILQGKITNASTATFHNAVLVTPGGWRRLGELAPGSSSAIEIPLAPRQGGPEFYSLTSSDILNLDDVTNDRELTPEEIRQEDLLDSVLSPEGNGVNRGNFGVYLMGWLDQSLLPVSLQGKAFDSLDTTLYIAELTPSVQYGSTPWDIPTEAMVWESSNPEYSPYDGLDQCQAGSYTLKFRPALPIKFSTIRSLGVNIEAVSPAAIDSLTASLWNVQTGDWQTIADLSWGWNDVPNPASFVAPSGEVRLRIDDNASSCIQISPTDITLQVEP